MKSNNIKLIGNFFEEKRNKTLFVNKVDDEKAYFYELVIKKLSKKFNTKLIYNLNNSEDLISNDLFDNRSRIFIHYLSNVKHINEILEKNCKNIIFTDYKNYKKYSGKYQTINGYNFTNDIEIFIKNFFNINNQYLINYCIEHPYLLLSEVEKFSVNENNYRVDPIIIQGNDFIIAIRKDIFNLRKKQIDIKKIFLKIKNEVIYKKFNFLVY
jgi:hypothetical protein